MGLNRLKGSKAFVEYSNDKDNIYKNTEKCNQKFILFFVQNFIFWAKKHQNKFYALFYYENFKQTRTLGNCI